MTVIELVPSEFFYSFSQILDDTEYILHFRWNARDGAWYMDISDVDEDVIERGIKLTLATSGRVASTDSRFPNGMLTVVDLSNEDIEPAFDDMGVRCVLVYFTAEELAS